MKKILSAMLILMLFSLFACSDELNDNKEVELVQLSDTSITLYEGQSYQLSSSIVPSDAENKSLTWISSHTGVCSVNDGIVTAISEGVSVVTAKAHNGKADSVRVEVKKIEAVSSIILSDIELSLEPGDVRLLSASARPESNSLLLPIIWSTSDESVATVDSFGKVTAIAEGACLIRADIEGVARAVCKVSVSGVDMDLSSIVSVVVEGLPKTYSRTDSDGNTVVSGVINSYEVERELTLDGRITVTVKICGKKTFDKDGAAGDESIFLKAALYEILPDGEEYKGTYGCTSGYISSGEDFELRIRYFVDKAGNYYNTGGELAFNVEMKQQQKQFKIILDYGEEEIPDEYD